MTVLDSTRKYKKTAAFLVCLAVGLLAASPLLDSRLVHASDSLPHYYSLVQLDHLVKQGIPYTRWFPDEASGFGAPYFQYYAPLGYYAAEVLALLGAELQLAFRFAWGLTLVGSALGMYFWTKDMLDEGPALVAAAAYACSPYLLFNSFFRGGFTEQFALVLVPWILWSFRRLAFTRRPAYLAAGALAYAALNLAHTLTALIFTPALVGYTLVLAWRYPSPSGRPRAALNQLLTLWVVVGLGLALSAFFWLPAFLERDALRTELVTASPSVDYRLSFVPLQALLSTPLLPAPRPSLSIVAAGLAVVGLFAQVRKSSRLPAAAEVWLSGLIVIGCVVLALPLSAFIWEALPALSLFQFPHRFLSVAVVFLAFLAGVGVQALDQMLSAHATTLTRWTYLGILAVVLVLLLGHARVLTRVKYYPPLPAIDVDFIKQKEREAAPMLGQFKSVFTPASVKELPPLEEQAQDGPQRLDLGSLPSGASLVSAEWAPLRYDLVLSSPQPFSALFRTYYFPGWRASVDGHEVSISVTEPYGQVSVQVPAGEHRLVVWFGSTRLRTAATLMSALGVAALGLAFVGLWYYHSRHRGKVTTI